MYNIIIIDLKVIEQVLADAIFPELKAGRPGWDVIHTQAVVTKLKEILDHSPTLKLDRVVLIIAAYAHDWGFAGMFENGQQLTFDNVKEAKKIHADRSAEKLAGLLKNPSFDLMTEEQKKRAVYLVGVHDKINLLTKPDELILKEADILGALDTDYVKPTFDQASNEKYMNKVREKHIPRFITDYGKEEVEKLFEKRRTYYKNIK